MTRRLLASWVSLALIVLIALELPLGISYARNQRTDELTRLERDATAVGALATGALEGESSKSLAGVVRHYGNEADDTIVVVDRRGNLIVGVSGASTSSAQRALSNRVVRTTSAGRFDVAVPVIAEGGVVGAVGISTPTSEADERIAGFWWRLAGIAAAVVGVTVLAAVLLSRWVTRPLRHLEDVAERVGAGDLTVRAIAGDGPPEVRALAGRFNETVAKLEQLVRAQEAFVADASHQLRTPLTALRLRLETGDVDGGLREVERMAGIVDALLALARSEAAAPEAVDLEGAVTDRVEAWQAAASAGRVAIETSVRGQALVGPERLAQVLDNLLANALAAAPEGSSIEVRGDAESLHVRDHGPGLSAADRDRAFDRFWSASGGSGLGLPIVKRLVEADGGSVELLEAGGGGLDVVLHLTRSQAASARS